MYRTFGIEGEGPASPLECAVAFQKAGFKGTLLSSDEEALFSQLLDDSSLALLFRNCRDLVEQIAQHSAGEELCIALDTIRDELHLDWDQLLCGINWYTHASQLDELVRTNPKVLPLTKVHDSLGRPCWYTTALGIQSCLALRAYVGLVFMRGDSMMQSMRSTEIERFPALVRYRDLFRNDLVRHVRNALAHGHVRVVSVGLLIWDREFQAIVTPGLLNLLCTWILVFYTSALAVVGKHEG